MNAEKHAGKGSRSVGLRRGLRGGAAATMTMTGAFTAFELLDWIGQLPPRQLIQRLFPDDTGPRTVNVITAIAHLSYGALLGGAFALLIRKPTRTRGAMFGIAVCFSNYELALPLAGMRQPLHRDDPREAAALVISHVVYGADLGRRLTAREIPVYVPSS